MTRILSLDHLTVFELTPPQLVATAAAAGFRYVGVRLNPVAPGEHQHPMLGNAPMLRETLARMHDTGVKVFDIGVFLLKKDTDVERFAPVLESGAKLGARHALVCVSERDDTVMAQMFGRLCDLGRQYGVAMDLEFVPWTGVKTIDEAARIVRMAARPNAYVLIDTIHVDRSGAGARELGAISPPLIAYAQVCDAIGPRPTDYETMTYQARNERAFPGEGDLDLVAMVGSLPRDIPLSLECPTKLSATLSALERAKRGRATIESLLEQVAVIDAVQT